MDVEIGEVSSTVRAVDGDSVLSPKAMQQVVRAVMAALRDEKAHAQRVKAEQKVSSGVTKEQAGDDR